MRKTFVVLGGALPLTALWLLPLIAGLLAVLVAAFDEAAWRAMLTHPQFLPALALSLFTGTVSLILAIAIAFWIVAGLHESTLWTRLSNVMAGFLSVPHLAFAIGFGFLIMPSGLIARLAGALAGWTSPPGWVTTQDPLGFSLIAALVLKEVPFIVWLIMSVMARRDVGGTLQRQIQVARSLSHGDGSIWMRILVPQLLRHLKWPLVVVWAYGASVVDMAIAIGPTQPPTLALVIWRDLNDVDHVINQRGTIGAIVLALCLAAAGLAFAGGLKGTRPLVRKFLVKGPSQRTAPRVSARILFTAFAAAYALVIILLGVMSVASRWPYPGLVPLEWRWTAWGQTGEIFQPLLNSLSIAGVSAALSLSAAVSWMECIDEVWDRAILAAAIAALALPAILIAQGHYLVFLDLGWSGTSPAVFLSQLAPVLAYVFIVLSGPYRSFDPRYRATSYGLNASAWRFWRSVKLPLMGPVLASAAAVGIAVSIAQYVPVQLLSAGRLPTLTTEAVTLSSGGNRQLLAAFSLMLAVIPLIAFLGAAKLRPRDP